MGDFLKKNAMGLGKEVRPLFTAETAKSKAYRKQKRQALVCPTGFEPAAFGVGVQRSIQLSYGHIFPSTLHSIANFYETVKQNLAEKRSLKKLTTFPSSSTIETIYKFEKRDRA